MTDGETEVSGPHRAAAIQAFDYGTRRPRVYPVTDAELFELMAAPTRWHRRRIVLRIMNETKFGENQ